VKGDRFIVRISINNLVENALKYGGDNPVEIHLYTKDNKAVIDVKDHGIGIPESERKRIFKKFFRVEDEEVRDTKGTGLGLYIVKQTINKHGGKIEVLDNQPKGTIFRVLMPLSKK
jgi:signal transduction histidine kinase